MADAPTPPPATNTVAFQGADGSIYDVPNDPAHVKKMLDAGFTVHKDEPGALQQVGEFARGLQENLPGIVKYNPLTWVEQGALKGVGALTGAKPIDELAKPPEHAAGTFVAIRSDGSRLDVPDSPENRQKMETAGFRIESPEETKTADYIARPENAGARGAAKVYEKKAASEFLFGVPEMAETHGMTDDERRNWEALKEEHNIAAGAGTVAGIAANMLTPGLNLAGSATKAERLAETALRKIGLEGTSLAGKVAMGAGRSAVGGAVYSAPHAVGQLVFEDPKKAGESMSYGIGVGALLGGAGPLASKFASTIKPFASNALSGAGITAESRIMKTLGMERGSMKKIGPEESDTIGRTLLDAGVNSPGMTQKTLIKNVESLNEKAGTTIGSVEKALDALTSERPEFAALGFHPKNVIDRIDKELFPKYEGTLYRSERKQLNDAMEHILEISSGGKLPAEIDSAEALRNFADTMSPSSFAVAQKLKSSISKGVDLGKAPVLLSDKERLAKTLWGYVRDELAQSVERVGSAAERGDLVEGYNLARKQYWATETVKDKLLDNLLAKEKGNRFFSPSDYVGAIAGHALAGPHGALGAVAGYVGKRIVESTPFQSTATWGLDKAQSAFRALAASEVTKQIQGLDQAIQQLATRGTQSYLSNRKVEEAKVSPISALIGGDEKDGGKALASFRDKIEPYMRDPDRLRKELGSLGATITDAGDGDAAFHFMQHQQAALQYLYNEMPKPPPNPALFYNPEWRPTPGQIKQFEDTVQSVTDPFFIVRKLEDGTLSNKNLEAVKLVFPEITQLIQSRVQAMGYEQQLASPKQERAPLPYDARLRLQRLTGALGDPGSTPQKIAHLQSLYGAPASSQGSAPPSKPMNVKPPTLLTDTQKAINR